MTKNQDTIDRQIEARKAEEARKNRLQMVIRLLKEFLRIRKELANAMSVTVNGALEVASANYSTAKELLAWEKDLVEEMKRDYPGEYDYHFGT